MFHIVAASSLLHSKNTYKSEKRRYESSATAILCLFLNINSLNQGKNLRRLQEDSSKKEKKRVVWHDVVEQQH